MGRRDRPRQGYCDVPADPHLFDILAQLDTTEQQERMEFLRASIDQLPQPERDVVNALYWERLTKGEVCKRFGLRRHDLERVLRRAYKELRERGL